jgi:hypothetical protein
MNWLRQDILLHLRLFMSALFSSSAHPHVVHHQDVLSFSRSLTHYHHVFPDTALGPSHAARNGIQALSHRPRRPPHGRRPAGHPNLPREFSSVSLHCNDPSTDTYPQQACLTRVGTNLCADDALSELTPCLSTTCNNPASTQNLIASLDVAFTPKAEYACQQAYGPANADKESSSVTLPLDGTCATSPYDFKSFLPDGVSRIKASNGCRIMLFSQEDCLGEAADTDIGTLSNGMCVFRGGRSARLTCRNELDGMLLCSCRDASYS